MARRSTAMSDDEIDATLAAGRDLQVATIGRDGWPHVTTVWYVVQDGVVTFRCFTKSQRLVNLRRDPRITVLAETGDAYDELRGVMVQGTARLSDDPDDVIDIYARVLAKVQGGEPDLDTATALFGRFASKNTVVRVEPRRVISWDHRKLDGAY